jgi:O-methyltransferase domain/Dimerisation domain
MSAQQSQPSTPPPAAQMMQLIWPGAMAAQAIYVAAKFGIADKLIDGARTIDELATATKTHGPSLRRLLRALTSLGVFREPVPGKFENTELSNTLRNDVPGSVRPWAIFLSAPFNWKLWGSLEDTIRTGEAAAQRVYGKPFWEYLAENPADAAVFNAAMSSRSEIVGAAVIGAYDFSRFSKVVDVGGGHGRLLHSILSTVPSLHGVLYDLPEVVANAVFLESDVASGRAKIIGGSFLESVPAGADAYILSGVINDWNDDDALTILRNCKRAISHNGRLLLATSIAKLSTAPADRGNFMDVYMMLYGGRDRDEADFRSLLSDAGFSLLRVIPTSTLTFIIESAPV